jgi:hypothetical protein
MVPVVMGGVLVEHHVQGSFVGTLNEELPPASRHATGRPTASMPALFCSGRRFPR